MKFTITLVALFLTTCRFGQPTRPLVAISVEPPTRPEPAQVLRAMSLLAESENTTPEKLMPDPAAVARAVQDQAEEKQLDPLLLLAIAWTETRFKVNMKGDYLNGKPRSCGITQVRTDFHGRPTCNQLLDPAFALGWTANQLNLIADDAGRVRLNRYNGGDYEVRVWRLVDWLRRQTTPVAMFASR